MGTLKIPRLQASRPGILAAVLAVASVSYLLLFLGSSRLDLPPERIFVARPESSAAPQLRPVRLYLEVVGVDALRDAMQVRLTVEPASGGPDGLSWPDRNLVLIATHDDDGQRIEVHARQPPPTTPVELDLYGGDISDYPLDRYRATLRLRCFVVPGPSGGPLVSVPITLVDWQRVLGYRLRTTIDQGAAGEQRISFDIRRSEAFMFFALAGYGGMIVLAYSAASIGILVYLRRRTPDPSLMSAVAAIVFALPALRGALPGSAPLGVFADLFIFLWTEAAAVCALAVVVATWVHTAPRREPVSAPILPPE